MVKYGYKDENFNSYTNQHQIHRRFNRRWYSSGDWCIWQVFLRIDKIIKVSATKEINQEIGKFETDQKLFKSGIRITIIEKDLLFNDVGSIDSDIEIDTKITKSQQFIYKVEIKEIRSVLGKFWGNKIANFEVTLEAQVADAAQYIPNEDGGKGWLKVKLADNKSIESLPAYLKVKPERVDNDSKIYETVDYKKIRLGKKVYMTLKFRIILTLSEQDTRNKRQEPKLGLELGIMEKKYLHTGGRSLGCITITKNTRWAEIYNALIKARKGDSVSVGILEVIDWYEILFFSQNKNFIYFFNSSIYGCQCCFLAKNILRG